MKRIVVDEAYTIVDFVIEENQKQISFWFSFTDEKIWTSCYIYNSEGELMGDVMSWSKSSNVISVGERSTISATKEEVKAGNYKIVILKQGIGTQEVEIICNQDIEEGLISERASFVKGVYQEEFDRIVQSESRYYKGDFHAHTYYSDGENNYDEVKEDLQRYGVDFIALTEHNRIAYGKKDIGVLNIPSFELTTEKGHINIHGIQYLAHHNIDFWKGNMTVGKILETYKESLTCICHPFLEPWGFSVEEVSLKDVDVIELINDPTYPDNKEANKETIKFFDYIWNSGAKIYGVGGSDCHMKHIGCYDGANAPSIYADPATYVFCDGLSIKNIIEGTRNGHTYIARGLELDICINDSKVLPGQRIENDEIDYQIYASGITNALTYRFIKDGQIILENNISREGVGTNIRHTFRLEEGSYLRCEILNEEEDVVAFINPIYIGERSHIAKAYNEVLEEYQQQRGITND